MDYIDNQIKEQIKQLEKLQSYKTELQEKNKSQEVNIEANINEIQKQVDDYNLYKKLKSRRLQANICNGSVLKTKCARNEPLLFTISDCNRLIK